MQHTGKLHAMHLDRHVKDQRVNVLGARGSTKGLASNEPSHQQLRPQKKQHKQKAPLPISQLLQRCFC